MLALITFSITVSQMKVVQLVSAASGSVRWAMLAFSVALNVQEWTSKWGECQKTSLALSVKDVTSSVIG